MNQTTAEKPTGFSEQARLESLEAQVVEQVVSEAIKVSHQPHDDRFDANHSTRQLTELATQLDDPESPVWIMATATAEQIPSPIDKVTRLLEIAKAQGPESPAWEQALGLGLTEEVSGGIILTGNKTFPWIVAEAHPPGSPIWKKAESIARAVKKPDQRTDALLKIAVVHGQASRYWDSAIAAAEEDEDAYSLAFSLWRIGAASTSHAPARTQPIFHRAAEVAKHIEDKDRRDGILKLIFDYQVQAGDVEDALDTIKILGPTALRKVKLFVEIAIKGKADPTLIPTAFEGAKKIHAQRDQVVAMVSLARLAGLDGDMRTEALDSIRNGMANRNVSVSELTAKDSVYVMLEEDDIDGAILAAARLPESSQSIYGEIADVQFAAGDVAGAIATAEKVPLTERGRIARERIETYTGSLAIRPDADSEPIQALARVIGDPGIRFDMLMQAIKRGATDDKTIGLALEAATSLSGYQSVEAIRAVVDTYARLGDFETALSVATELLEHPMERAFTISKVLGEIRTRRTELSKGERKVGRPRKSYKEVSRKSK